MYLFLEKCVIFLTNVCKKILQIEFQLGNYLTIHFSKNIKIKMIKRLLICEAKIEKKKSYILAISYY